MLKKFFEIFLLISLFTNYISCTNKSIPYLKGKSSWAEKTLKSLSLREKIGQLFIVAAASNFSQPTEMLASAMRKCPYNMDPNHVEKMIKEQKVGGLIFLFKSDPKTQKSFIERYQEKSKLPLIIAQDSEWGLSMRLDADPKQVVRYPRNMTLGALVDEQLVYDMGYEVGKQCAALGVHINLAPVVDVNNNPKNPVIHDRSFGDDPERVSRLAILYAKGLQDAGVIAFAKHFPGHGDTDVDSHLDLPVIKHDKTRLNEIELQPFKKIIQEGIGGIMSAHLSVPAFDSTPNLASTLSYPIITEELKNNLDFHGLVATDGLGMDAIAKHFKPGEIEFKAYLAGNDILLCPLDVPRAVELIEQAIKNGQLSEEDLNQRVLKVLKAKEWAFDKQKNFKKNNEIKSLDLYLVRKKAYDLQSKLYHNAITLAKNNANQSFDSFMLKNSHIIQIGTLPDNRFAETLKNYNCIVHNYSAMLDNKELETCLKNIKEKNKIIIGVCEMNKFAQQKFGISSNTVSLISKLKEIGKTVTVLIFGTPYSLPYFKAADNLLVAYEDAPTAQEAMVNILCGQMQAMGKLPVQVI
ncbi:MAG: glycoside hydrolase family 3 N-terminal domain-containing protein [Candidatus Babeliales bacterium]